jgi:hypothetical protein
MPQASPMGPAPMMITMRMFRLKYEYFPARYDLRRKDAGNRQFYRILTEHVCFVFCTCNPDITRVDTGVLAISPKVIVRL